MATPPRTPLRHPVLVLAAATLVLSVLGTALVLSLRDGGDPAPPGADTAATTDSGTAPEPGVQRRVARAAAQVADIVAAAAEAPYPKDPRVLVISVDGLASYAMTERDAPTLRSLLRGGVGTLNARTAVEATVTLPNHTGMVTGRPIDAEAGGHGVTWNHDSERTVADGVSSIFSSVADAGGSSGLFAEKAKFEMWDRAWPGALDQVEIDPGLARLSDALVDDLTHQRRDLTFFHIAAPDVAGHAEGWASRGYRAAVGRADATVARVLGAVGDDPALRRDLLVVVTADHGGTPGTEEHSDAEARADYRIPFLVWGPGIESADLYDLNPDYADPGTEQPRYDDAAPVRNADVANLVAGLLALPPVEGSSIGVEETLDVR